MDLGFGGFASLATLLGNFEIGSRDIYAWLRRFNAGEPQPARLPDMPPSFPWLLKHKRGRKTDNCQRLRLTVLYLLLREHSARFQQPGQHLPEGAAQVFEEVTKLRDSYGRSVEEVVDFLRGTASGLGCEKELEKALDDIKVFYRAASPNPVADLTEAPSLFLSEVDVVHLVDPLPTGWDVPLSLDKSKKVGKGLSGLKLRTSDPDFDIKKLLSGDGSVLSDAEKLAAQRYLREMLPSKGGWPAWLGGDG